MEYVLSHIIPEYLSDREKLRLFATCKTFLVMRDQVRYSGEYYYNTVKDVPYISCITDIQDTLNYKYIYYDNVFTEHQKQHVTYLYFEPKFKNVITTPDILIRNMPYNITVLNLWSYNGSLSGWLPKTLKELHLIRAFNHEIYPGDLPDSLQVLFIANSVFNKPIRGLPTNLVRLFLRFVFNQPLNNLPDSLEYLELSDEFNQPLVGCMPKKLKILDVGEQFNHPISHYLCEGLESLMIGGTYTHTLTVPRSLRVLHINHTGYEGCEIDPFRHVC